MGFVIVNTNLQIAQSSDVVPLASKLFHVLIPVNWISFKLAAMLISLKYAVFRKESTCTCNLFEVVNRENNF